MEYTLQQKQQYLRNSIDQDSYQEFFQFCTNVVGSVDINQWSMQQIKHIVNKFNQQQNSIKNNQNNHQNPQNQHKYSYNDYQSTPYHQQSQYYENSQVQHSEISQCKSSKVQKKSAVDLLDSVLSEKDYSSIKTQPKATSSPKKQSNQNYTTNSNSGNAFDQFDFWTSTVSNKPKNQSEIRAKSSTQYTKTTSQANNMSPPTPKNTYNQPNSNYLHPQGQDQVRQRNSTTNLTTTQFDIFNVGTEPNKTSPYMKKQQKEPYQAHKAHIRLKQVKNIEPNKSEGNQNKGIQGRNNGDYFQQEVSCFKSMIRNQLADRNLGIFIDKHEIIQRKLLAADYAMFNVKITPLNIECKRNYEDFAKLRNNLAKFFPGICLPHLQPSSWLSSTSADFIANQKKMLQFFSRDLIRNKQLRNSRVMEDFLTLKDHKAIKRKFQKYEAMENLKGLEELCLVEGNLKVSLNPQQKNYIEHLQKFLQRMNSLYEKQQGLTQSMINQYSQMMKTSKLLIALTEEIQKQVKDFNSKVLINTIKHLGHSIRLIRETYKEDLSNLMFEHELNSKKILPFLKYERKNFLQLEKLIEIEKKMKKSFDKRTTYEKIGVGETYKSQSNKQSKKGILEQSPSLLVFKYQVGYIDYQVCHEGQRIFDELAVKTAIRWQTLGESYLDRLTSSIDYWQNIKKMDISKFSTELTY